MGFQCLSCNIRIESECFKKLLACFNQIIKRIYSMFVIMIIIIITIIIMIIILMMMITNIIIMEVAVVV